MDVNEIDAIMQLGFPIVFCIVIFKRYESVLRDMITSFKESNADNLKVLQSLCKAVEKLSSRVDRLEEKIDEKGE